MNKKPKQNLGSSEEDKRFPLPVYKKEDDIYSREKEEPLDDEDESGKRKSGDNKDQSPGEDLDVPGAELDDAEEAIGEEDEENNYYSLGGDDNNELEEDNG